MEQYKKALDKNKNYGKALVHLGQIYLQRTDVDNAKEYLKRASKIIKKDPAVYHSLGLAAHIKGEETKAIKYWKKALRLNKNFKPALENLKLHDVHIQKKVALKDSLKESEILEQRKNIENKIKFLEVLESPKNDPFEFYLGRKGFVYLHNVDFKSYTYIDGEYNYQVISKPTVKKVLQIILSMIVHAANLQVENIFWEVSYGHGQYYIYNRENTNNKEIENCEAYTEGRYQKKKTPVFFKFRINSKEKLDDQQLNGNILLLKEEDKYYLIDNLGTDISYKLINSLSSMDGLNTTQI
ncbi:MAG: tetratricopeptide repeat protein, partial [Calditrichia bacterium]|nr:tetratricopeptide repeat protein [Calditrichia bacterium]